MNGFHNEEIKEGMSIKGTIIVRKHPAGTIHLYQSLMDMGRTELARKLIEEGEIAAKTHNLIVIGPNTGKDLIVQWLISGYSNALNYPYGPDFGEIGTGSATPTTSDTQLGNPIARSSLTYVVDDGMTMARLQFFFPDATLPNQTYYEFGTFVGGSTVLGSGQMFNHALFSSPYSKSAGVDTTCEVDFAVS